MKKTFILYIILTLNTIFLHAQLKPLQDLGLKKSDFKVCLLAAPEKLYPNIRSIAVLDFKTNDGEESGLNSGAKIADFITHNLVDEERGIVKSRTHISGVNTKIYDVMDRSSVMAILNENPNLKSDISENEAKRIGELLGVDAVIIGNATYKYVDDKSSSSYRSEGKTYTTYEISRKLTAEARMSIVDVATGEFIGAKSGSQTKKDSKSSSKGYPSATSLSPPTKLAESAFRDIAYYLCNYMSPYFYSTKLPIENIKIKEYKQRAKDAREQMKLGNIAPAFQLYNAIYTKDEYNSKAAYNLGLLYEAVGDFINAKKYFDIAQTLKEENKSYEFALKRTEKEIKIIEDLAQFGISIEQYSFEAGNSEKLLRKKVKIRGDKSNRKPIYKEASLDSNILKKVPGTTEFSVIENLGDWFLIDLKLNNETGYVFIKDVKVGK